MSFTEQIRRADEREFRRLYRGRQLTKALDLADASGIEAVAVERMVSRCEGDEAKRQLARDDAAELAARAEWDRLNDGERFDGQG